MTTRRPALRPEAEQLRDRIAHSIRYILGTTLEDCSSSDLFRTFAWALRERLVACGQELSTQVSSGYRASPRRDSVSVTHRSWLKAHGFTVALSSGAKLLFRTHDSGPRTTRLA